MVEVMAFGSAFTGPNPAPATAAGLTAYVAGEPWKAAARAAAAAAVAGSVEKKNNDDDDGRDVRLFSGQGAAAGPGRTSASSGGAMGSAASIGAMGLGIGVMGLENLRQASAQAGSWAKAATTPLREQLSQQARPNDDLPMGGVGEGEGGGGGWDGPLLFPAAPSTQSREDADTMAFLSSSAPDESHGGAHDAAPDTQATSTVDNVMQPMVDAADEWTMSFAASLTSFGQQAADAVQSTTPRWQ